MTKSEDELDEEDNNNMSIQPVEVATLRYNPDSVRPFENGKGFEFVGEKEPDEDDDDDEDDKR